MGKKKTLVILLLIPFVIGLLVFVSINVINITVASDITDIKWMYDAIEGFKIRNEGYKLEATPVINSDLILAPGNDLTWYIREDNTKENDQVARIDKKEDGFYFFALNEGDCEVVCSNVRGTKLKSFKAHVFKNGSVIINTKRKESTSKIDKTRYYGEFDLKYSKVELDKYEFVTPSIEVVPTVYHEDGSKSKDVIVLETSKNLTYDTTKNIIKINGTNVDEKGNVVPSYIKLGGKTENYLEGTFTFNVIPNAVNVYNYNDLLMATNFSSKGEKVCLQTSLGSLRDVYEGKNVALANIPIEQATKLGYVTFVPESKKSDTEFELFGNYNANKNSFNFEKEVYEFDTTYNHKFIDDVNKTNNENNSIKVKTGIRVQQDFYGNGYTINENNLAFPNHATIDKGIARLRPGEGDLFKGPLALVAIGPVEGEGSIVKAYGQDNSGLYIDGDNITINDLKLRNIDDNVNRANFAFTGSVIDVNGKNVTIKNSILSHGKNIVRAFDSDNLLIDNSILKTSGEFNLKVGSNEYINVNEDQKIDISYEGISSFSDFKEFFNTKMDAMGEKLALDGLLMPFAMGEVTNSDSLYNALMKVQEYLNNTKGLFNDKNEPIFNAKIDVKDTLFGDSGIFSIAFDTMFNGSYLYNGYPSMIADLFKSLGFGSPTNIGGTSKPVELNLLGKTKFYDWKNIDEIDINCLIEQSIKPFLEQVLGKEVNITVDDIFPMKKILHEKAKLEGYVHVKDNKDYLNTEVAWFGGGLNLSKLNNLTNKESNSYSEIIPVDLLERSFKESSGDMIVDALGKCVLFAAGYNPFKFITNDQSESSSTLLDITSGPSVEELIQNKK